MGSDPVSAALIALLLGLVQGATEFLPISSSAHLYAIPYLFGINDPLLTSLAFAAVIHLGTLAAVLVTLRSDVTRLTRVALRTLTSLGRHRGDSADERLILAIVIGTIPAVLLGLTAGDLLEGAVRTPLVVAGAGSHVPWRQRRMSRHSAWARYPECHRQHR
jgi:undecaprenyl-diphosphatase